MNTPSQFKVIVVATEAKDHIAMARSAESYFENFAAENNLAVDFTFDASQINAGNLAAYQVFVMLQLAPFDMTASQQRAMQDFVESGKGWVGVHAAGLTGKEFVSSETTYWQWFEDLLGGITYSPHPAYQKGTVVVEDRTHPATANLPERFELSDEWYEFNESPRGRVRVLATADESTYRPNKPMGDHPVVWVNEQYRRVIYIAIGHDSSALTNANFSTLLRDSLLWAGS